MSVMLIRVQSPLLRTLKHKGRYVCWSMVTVIFDGSCFLSLGNKVIFHTFLLRSVPDSLDNLKPCLYIVAKDIGEETCIGRISSFCRYRNKLWIFLFHEFQLQCHRTCNNQCAYFKLGQGFNEIEEIE